MCISDLNVLPEIHVVEGAYVVEGLHYATLDPVEGPNAAVHVQSWHCRDCGSEYGGGRTSSGYSHESEHPLDAHAGSEEEI